MRIRLIAVGERMPGWVQQGFGEYARRLPSECALQLVEIPAGRRGKGADIARITAEEGRRQLAAVGRGVALWTLDQGGRAWDTPGLARRLERWLQEGRDLALLVGGPEGLAPDCRGRADGSWSLSPLTLPHPLVRVIVAEQLYRAWSILAGHPYHR